MANEIGPLAVKAVVNPKGIDEGLDAVRSKLKAGAGKLAEEASKAGDEAGKSLGSRFASAAKWGLAGIAGAGLLDGASLAASYAAGASYIRAIGHAARAASVPMAEFQSVAWAFGKNEDALDGLVKLNTALSKAAVLGENASAFTSLGLDPEKLLAGGGAYEQVADKIKAMGSAWQQGFAAQRIWGEEYKRFLPTLAQGGQFIREQRDLLAGFGATAGEGLFGAVRTADRFFNQLSALKQGFLVQVTEGVAPLLAELTERVPRLFEFGVTFKGMGARIINVFEAVGTYVAGWFDDPEAMWGGVKAWFFETMEWLGGLISKTISDAVQAGFSALNPLARLTEARRMWEVGTEAAEAEWLRERYRGFREEPGGAGGTWGSGRPAGGEWGAALGPWQGRLAEMAEAARKRVADVGQAARDNDPFAIWQESAARKLKGVESPLEKFKEQWEGLSRLQARGRSALGVVGPLPAGFEDSPLARIAGAEGNLLRGAMVRQLHQQFGVSGQPMMSAALQQGTAGAASAVNQARFSARETTEQLLKRLVDLNERLVKLGEEEGESLDLRVVGG